MSCRPVSPAAPRRVALRAPPRAAAVLFAAALAPGCATTPLSVVREDAAALVATRVSLPPAMPADADGPAVPVSELPGRDEAVLTALQHSPRLQAAYARLGLSHADRVQAARLANPSLSLGVFLPDGGGPARVAAGLVQRFAEAVTLPARKRLATLGLERETLALVATALTLARDVDAAWIGCVAATRQAGVRDEMAAAATLAADLAQRYHAAGNLSELDLARARADASDTGLAALAAQTDARTACRSLAELMGLPAPTPDWTVRASLPAVPADASADADTVAPDIEATAAVTAARADLARREAALATARRYRLLGDAEAGLEVERDTDRERTLGPNVTLELPLFDRGEGRVARAQARRDLARAALADARVRASHALADARARLADARRAALGIETALLPQRRAAYEAVARRVNYMLLGVFEQIDARRAYYSALDAAVETTRDYWLARIDLAHAAGVRLPDSATAAVPPLDLDALLGVTPDATADPTSTTPSAPSSDPHAGHAGHAGHPQGDSP